MIEVLKQLVDALENHSAIKHPQQIHYRDAAIQAGKQAIAQLALDAKAENARELGLDYEQEPMAWYCCFQGQEEGEFFLFGSPNSERYPSQYKTPLYEHLPQRTWVDLTRTQMQDIYFEVLKEHRGGHQMEGQLAFGEALQSILKERNT
jgi:hypothetical protein